MHAFARASSRQVCQRDAYYTGVWRPKKATRKCHFPPLSLPRESIAGCLVYQLLTNLAHLQSYFLYKTRFLCNNFHQFDELNKARGWRCTNRVLGLWASFITALGYARRRGHVPVGTLMAHCRPDPACPARPYARVCSHRVSTPTSPAPGRATCCLSTRPRNKSPSTRRQRHCAPKQVCMAASCRGRSAGEQGSQQEINKQWNGRVSLLFIVEPTTTRRCRRARRPCAEGIASSSPCALRFGLSTTFL